MSKQESSFKKNVPLYERKEIIAVLIFDAIATAFFMFFSKIFVFYFTDVAIVFGLVIALIYYLHSKNDLQIKLDLLRIAIFFLFISASSLSFIWFLILYANNLIFPTTGAYIEFYFLENLYVFITSLIVIALTYGLLVFYRITTRRTSEKA